MQKLAAAGDQQKVKILSLFNTFKLTQGDETKLIEYGALIVTDAKLLITSADFKWLLASETSIIAEHTQTLNNLEVDVDYSEGTTFKLSFDLEQGEPETWQLTFDTDMSCESAFETISQSWEKLFRMPLTRVTRTVTRHEESIKFSRAATEES